MNFWEMTYGEALRQEILAIGNIKQRNLFLRAYEMMGDHIQRHEDDEFLTFGEFYNMYCRV